MAKQFTEVEESRDGQISIKGSDCYSCWYFISIIIEHPYNANYILTVTQNDESISGQYREMRPDQPASMYITAG